jgi:hypothetical protein
MSQNIYFAVLEYIYNNVVPHCSTVLISCNHSIMRLISFTKNSSNQRSILSYCSVDTMSKIGRIWITFDTNSFLSFWIQL